VAYFQFKDALPYTVIMRLSLCGTKNKFQSTRRLVLCTYTVLHRQDVRSTQRLRLPAPGTSPDDNVSTINKSVQLF
jgi:hypothetical protein